MSARRENTSTPSGRLRAGREMQKSANPHSPGDDTDKYLLFCSIYKFLPLSYEHSCLNVPLCHPSCLHPPFVPHPLSSNMNPREQTCARARECGGLWRLAYLPVLLVLQVYRHTLIRLPKLSRLNASALYKSPSLCTNTLMSGLHAQQGLPGGNLLSRTRAPRWTKSKPNLRRTLTIHLLNGSVTIHNRF